MNMPGNLSAARHVCGVMPRWRGKGKWPLSSGCVGAHPRDHLEVGNGFVQGLLRAAPEAAAKEAAMVEPSIDPTVDVTGLAASSEAYVELGAFSIVPRARERSHPVEELFLREPSERSVERNIASAGFLKADVEMGLFHD